MKLFNIVFFLFVFLFFGFSLDAKAQAVSEAPVQDLFLLVKNTDNSKPSLKFQPVMPWDVSLPKPQKQIKKFKVPLPGFLGRVQEKFDSISKIKGDGFTVSGKVKYNFNNGNYKFQGTFAVEPRVIYGLGKKLAGIFK